MKLLLTSDLHLGRSSARVPDDVRRDELRTEFAWGRIVDLALREKVSVVCLGGDVVDQDNKFWEAIGALERGVRRLAKAGVRTVAVAGNHDHDVLIRLADQLPSEHFTLLGRTGEWERLTIEEDGQPVLCVDGWSFPSEHVHQSPLDSYSQQFEQSVPVLGIVHGDLDVANSPYGPLDLAKLQSLPVSAWLLGHIHAPRLIEGWPWILYPGSPQALDPGETGPHGPWILEVTAGDVKLPTQKPLSSIRYGRHTVDVTGAMDDADLETSILDGVRAESADIAAQSGSHLVHLSLRLCLEGRTPVADRVADIAERLTKDLSLPLDNGSVAIESVDVQVVPDIDLHEHAGTRSAPGALARVLLELDRSEPSEDVAQLIREVRHELERADRQKEFAGLDRREVTEEMVRGYLRKNGRELLTQLVLVHQTS